MSYYTMYRSLRERYGSYHVGQLLRWWNEDNGVNYPWGSLNWRQALALDNLPIQRIMRDWDNLGIDVWNAVVVTTADELHAAVAAAQPGDWIQVGANISTRVDLNTSGTPERPIRLSAVPGEWWWIDNFFSTNPDSIDHMLFVSGDNWLIEQVGIRYGWESARGAHNRPSPVAAYGDNIIVRHTLCMDLGHYYSNDTSGDTLFYGNIHLNGGDTSRNFEHGFYIAANQTWDSPRLLKHNTAANESVHCFQVYHGTQKVQGVALVENFATGGGILRALSRENYIVAIESANANTMQDVLFQGNHTHTAHLRSDGIILGTFLRTSGHGRLDLLDNHGYLPNTAMTDPSTAWTPYTESGNDWVRRTATLPTTAQVFTYDDDYEEGRGYVAVHNWPNDASVTIDPTGIGTVGEPLYLYNSLNPLAGPVWSTAAWDGNAFSFAMTGTAHDVAKPMGLTAPATTAPETFYGTFRKVATWIAPEDM